MNKFAVFTTIDVFGLSAISAPFAELAKKDQQHTLRPTCDSNDFAPVRDADDDVALSPINVACNK
jgi:hypothetical protein